MSKEGNNCEQYLHWVGQKVCSDFPKDVKEMNFLANSIYLKTISGMFGILMRETQVILYNK